MPGILDVVPHFGIRGVTIISEILRMRNNSGIQWFFCYETLAYLSIFDMTHKHDTI